MDSLLCTLTTGFRKIRVTNTTDTSFPTRTLTANEPTGSGNAVAQTTLGVFECVTDMGQAQKGGGGASSKNRAMIIPFGTGADNTTFDMRVYGWYPVMGNTTFDPNTVLWYPMLLGEFNVTLSAQVGVAGKVLVAADRLADTIAIASTSANQGVSVDVVSDANDTGAHLIIDLKGAWKLECTFDMTGATDGNALVAFY